MERRSLSEGYHDEDHHHSHHDHSDHEFDPSNIKDTLADLKHSLRGSELRIGKRRRVQGGSFAFWVDIYIEIDHALCNANGETCATGIGPKTVNYGEFGVRDDCSGESCFDRHLSLSLSIMSVVFFLSLCIQ
jgi:hypothetical protein